MEEQKNFGRFSEGFASWRRMLAAVPDEARVAVFANAAADVAGYVGKGLDKVVAVDELADIATAYAVGDVDVVQTVIAEAFKHVEVEHVPDDIEQQQPQQQKTNGRDQKPPPTLELIDIRAWQNIAPKPRAWIVRDRIPDKNVTLLTGVGGIGKTLLMQQLSVATVLGRDWIGEMPELGPVLFITAEDDEEEMHFRYDKIAKFYGTTFDQLADAGLHLLSLAGKDCAMAIADHRGIVRPTELFQKMVRTVREIRPRWIGLDTAADVFLCNERDRSEVRQCISLLRGICIELETAIMLLAHPSLSGISSGSGLSGSTAWHNSVRSRMYLKNEKQKDKSEGENDDDEIDGNGTTPRVLEFMKSNYSALAKPVRLVWQDGLFAPQETLASLPLPQRQALEQQAERVFLDILARYNRQGIIASHKDKSPYFAPRIFAHDPQARELHRSIANRIKLLRGALLHLMRTERVSLGTGPKHLPQSRQTECIYAGGTLL